VPADAATPAPATPATEAEEDDGDADSDEDGVDGAAVEGGGISFFERYLSLWVLLCIIAGGLIGYYAPAVPAALETAQFAGINAIVAVLLWVMICPMLVNIDFASLVAVKNAPGAVVLTTVINYAVKPFTGFGLAVLFMNVFYPAVMPDPTVRAGYIAGIVLLAG
jgi:arsenite transporter